MAEFIVAIELGSTKITGIAGQKNLDGSFSIRAVAKEDGTECIRKGVIYNIDKTVRSITNIVSRLEKQLKTKIACVYVGIGGQSLRSIKNMVRKDFSELTIITDDMVDEMRDTNRSMPYPDMIILNAAVQEYKVDTQNQIDPVGIQARRLEGNFLNIVWRKSSDKILNDCFEKAGVKIAELRISILSLANNVLTDNEKRTGCVLVDLGAETTSVAVYYKNILRHLSVIPLGSKNITRDIAYQQIDENDAERLKLKYGNATGSTTENQNEMIPIDDLDRKMEMKEFNNIVEARLEEIVENVLHQIPTEYLNNLLGGIILTGGGANMKNIDTFFRNSTNGTKVRIASFVNQTIHTMDSDIKARNGMYNTVLGLMCSGDINCAGPEISDNLFDSSNNDGDIFGGGGSDTTHKTDNDNPEKVSKREDREREDRLRQEREEEEERMRLEIERERLAEEARIRKENSWWNKLIRQVKRLGEKMIEEEE